MLQIIFFDYFYGMLLASHLEYRYGNGRLLEFPAIHCDAGQVLLITGASGSGKTTLLHLLAGLLLPVAGEIRISDTVINRLPLAQLDRFRGRHTGIIYQQSHFIDALSVRDNLLLAPYLAGKRSEAAGLGALCRALGIHHLLGHYPAQLSQGEQQRVSIARALLHSPPLILADEPTASLDDHNCRAVAQLLEQQAVKRNAALVIVTHDNRLKELFAHQINIIKNTAELNAFT
jgi:ABC-type lipoprotein export system ATPase subunit